MTTIEKVPHHCDQPMWVGKRFVMCDACGFTAPRPGGVVDVAPIPIENQPSPPPTEEKPINVRMLLDCLCPTCGSRFKADIHT